MRNVNTTDLADAIRLGCRTMCNVFNADDNDIPFFASQVRPNAWLRFSSAHSEAHVPGRHLNALLTAEEVLGLKIAESAIEKHAAAAFFSYSGPLPLPLNRQKIGGPLVQFLPHNIREGFHALYALTRYRNSTRARELAEASIAAIPALWNPERGWDLVRIGQKLGLRYHGGTFISELARAIGPLVKFYRATKHKPALDLALALKDHALDGFFPPDGSYPIERHGTHAHSTTCTLSSLAQLADLTGDGGLMERVRAFYQNGLWQIRDGLGWSIENSALDCRHPDRGEGNNTGDIVETALILGAWGHVDCYHDAERILRGHLLPSQLRDVSFIQDPPNPAGEDGLRDVANRHLGAWGFPAPYGHAPVESSSISFNMDIVGGVVASLCEAYRAATRFDDNGHWINLLFDRETEAVRVKSPYPGGRLEITVKRAAPLHVRIPPWADYRSLPPLANGYLTIQLPSTTETISLEFTLPRSDLVLTHRSRTIHCRFRGDQVVAMENFGTDLTFFDPWENRLE